jgi:hypothetical protein
VKRLLVFLLLLALGFGVLAWLAGGGAPLPRPNLGGGERKPNAPTTAGQGVTVQQGGVPATFTQTGPIDIVAESFSSVRRASGIAASQCSQWLRLGPVGN